MTEADGPPSWVDATFMRKVLRRSGDPNAILRSVTFAQVGEAGDHYASTMYRATVKTDKGTKTMIVKTLPPGDVMKEAVEESGVFRIEAAMFTSVVPGMHKVLNAAAGRPFPPLSARCFYHGLRPESFLVIEDLAPQGFRIADRRRGLDLKHSLLAVRTLARFHAASVELLNRDPSLIDKLVSDFPDTGPKADMFRMYVTSSLQKVADACRSWADFPEEYAEIFESRKDGFFDKIFDVYKPKPDSFNVIIHGDFWVNNMMFRYDKDEVMDIRLVDLQISHVTSPVYDLLYFLSTSVSQEVLRNKIDLLLRQYYGTLSETLDMLGLEEYPLEDFLKDIDEGSFWVFFGCACVLPILKTDEVPVMDEFFDGESKGNDFIYSSSLYERWMRLFLPEFHRRGWLS